MSEPKEDTNPPEDGLDAIRRSLAVHKQNRARFCVLPGKVKPDHPELVSAANTLMKLARSGSGASAGAARLLHACFSGVTAFNIDDFRKLDPHNFHAAMIVLNFALFEGCERILEDEEMEWLRRNFEFANP
ncbi:MAG: hypothetical protein RIA08_06220 [Roseovarius sp.]|uniref:DUF7673 family protein n=1 Tax=Bacteria TaxID=2 RepID=UPI0032ED45BB